MSKPPLGTGQRFHALEQTLARRHGVQNPAALAAYIGRKKYGNAGMATLARHERGQRIHKHRHVRQQARDLHPDAPPSYPGGKR